jgi:hypothetical protein
MARGKNKLRKGERQATKLPTPAGSAAPASASAAAAGTAATTNGSAAASKNANGTSSALTVGGRGSLLPDDFALGKHAHDTEDGHEYEYCDQ